MIKIKIDYSKNFMSKMFNPVFQSGGVVK